MKSKSNRKLKLVCESPHGSIKKDKGGWLHVDLKCEFCGKAITKTDVYWGMMCEDECVRNKYQYDPMANKFDAFLKRLINTYH